MQRQENTNAAHNTLTISYRDGIVQFDKILVTNIDNRVTGKGGMAENCAALPVNLITYHAALATPKTVWLSWSTSAEIKNREYRLERSSDGTGYVTIATIAAIGNSFGKHDHSYLDQQPIEGNNYYRLVQVDIDGNQLILGVRIVNITFGRPGSIQVYPNPAHSQVNIQLGTLENRKKEIRIYDVSGELVFSKFLVAINGLIKVSIDKRVAPGVYRIWISGDGYASVVFQ